MGYSRRFEQIARDALVAGSDNAVFVTTSWDDGHVLDHKLAGLLDRYGVSGTFYVAPRNVEMRERDRLRARDLCALAADFEIGGHTLTHVRLPALPDEIAAREIRDGKDSLEQTIGTAVTSFCYPGGAYDQRHTTMVDAAGFSVGRTVQRWVTRPGSPLEMHTTVNAYRHLVDLRPVSAVAAGSLSAARRMFLNWDVLAITLFDQVLATGGVFHLWGHSWEIDDRDDWDRLERVLAYVGHRTDVEYLTNGEVALKAPA